MNTFIFRNNTIELLFGSKDVSYSGYDDISTIPQDASSYIWFYQVPVKHDMQLLAEEIDGYWEKFEYVCSQIPASKKMVALTLSDLFGLNIVTSDCLLRDCVRKFNSKLYDYSRTHANVKIVDIDDFLSRYDSSTWIDWKFYFISQTIINPRLASDFKKWFDRKMEEIELKRKKCLVLDLDNTLWGGILGEDGLDGIKIGGDYPGKAFLYFQEALVELSKTGVILAICSKNNENDVLEAWEKNPFIVLDKKYISAYRINWNDKVSNIKELADELNIGLDSFVFVDDNPTERELVRQLLPMVEVPEFPTQPYGLMAFYKSLVEKYFSIYSITEEDRKKTAQYKANAQRASEQRKFSDINEYIKSLNIEIDILKANEFNIPRIAQMTQKTNQFNLTTKRYTDSDVSGFIDKGWEIYCISVSDKFGDNGITGAVFVEKKGENARIDSFLLSCRILGKGIENAFLKSILNHLKDIGIKEVEAEFIPSAKNAQVVNFYDGNGFTLTEESEGKKYSINLTKADITLNDLYKIEIK